MVNPEGDGCGATGGRGGHGTQVTGLIAGDNYACKAYDPEFDPKPPTGGPYWDDQFTPSDCPASRYGWGVQHHDAADGLAPGAQIVFQGIWVRCEDASWTDCGVPSQYLETSVGSGNSGRALPEILAA